MTLIIYKPRLKIKNTNIVQHNSINREQPTMPWAFTANTRCLRLILKSRILTKCLYLLPHKSDAQLRKPIITDTQVLNDQCCVLGVVLHTGCQPENTFSAAGTLTRITEQLQTLSSRVDIQTLTETHQNFSKITRNQCVRNWQTTGEIIATQLGKTYKRFRGDSDLRPKLW